MATDNSPTQDSEPAWYVTLPDFPEVSVTAQPHYGAPGFFRFDHSGFYEDLVGTGVMTVAMTIPNGKRHRDPDGGAVHLTRYWRLKDDGQPHRYCKILRSRPLVELARWPGALEALAAYGRYQRWDKEQRPWRHDPARIATVLGCAAADLPRPPRPALRLVVDNTREVTP